MNGMRVFWQQRRVRQVGSGVEKSRKKTKRGYGEARIREERERERKSSSFRLSSPEEVGSCSWEAFVPRDGERHIATASPPYVALPLFCSRCLLSFFPRGVRRLRGAMPCYPHDVRRANCTSDELATIVFYNEIDHLIIVRAQLLARPPLRPPPRGGQNLLKKAIFRKRVSTLEYIFAFIKNQINFFWRTYPRNADRNIRYAKMGNIFFFF